MLYMAYGMNTNRDAMSVRCPKAKALGGFYLPDTRLVFRGVADIVPDREHDLPCCAVGDHSRLSTFARPAWRGYPHIIRQAEDEYGDWITYEMNNKSRTSPPNGGYYKMIDDGYKDFGLDDYWLRRCFSRC